MNPISRLKLTGMSQSAIADGIGVSSQMVGMYERWDRFPSGKRFICIVELAESRGITLLARDFIEPKAACEDVDIPDDRPRAG